MREGVSFTQETTLSGQRPARIARQAKDAGYYVRLYYVGISSEAEALKRIANRVAKGGHDIPREDVHRRYGERHAALAAVLPYCDEAVFFDNENGFVEVAEYRNGELLCKGEYRPRGWRSSGRICKPSRKAWKGCPRDLKGQTTGLHTSWWGGT